MTPASDIHYRRGLLMPRDVSSNPGKPTALANHPQRAWFTPLEVGRRYRIKPARVISFIRAGLLRAIDVASPDSSRPRFRIKKADLIAFEISREVRPRPKKSYQKRRSKGDLIEFF